MTPPKLLLVPALILTLTFTLLGQPYKENLVKGDLNAVENQLTALGLSPKKEPLLAVYLAGAGKTARAAVVKQLLDRGADPAIGRPLTSSLDPASGVYQSADQAEIVKLLLDRGAMGELTTGRIGGENLLDFQLGRVADTPQGLKNAQVAAFLLNQNLRLSPRRRAVANPRFAVETSALTDDLDQVRKNLLLGTEASYLFDLTLAAGSDKSVDFLVQMFGVPGDLSKGLPFVPYAPKVAALLLDRGGAVTDLYQAAIAARKADVVRLVRNQDSARRWVPFVGPALAAGADCYDALTNSSQDLAAAGLDAGSAAVLADLMYGKSFLIKEIQSRVGAFEAGLVLKSLPPADPTQTARLARYSSKVLTRFQVGPAVGTVDEASHTVALTAPGGSKVEALGPRVEITGASVSPPSGSPQNFTSPVVYTVTAEDGSTQEYKVTVRVPKSDKAIVSFSFPGLPAVGQVDEKTGQISISLPPGTDVTALVPQIGFSGVSLVPKPGVSVNFTAPVTFTVTAEDGTFRSYRVTASVPPADTPAPTPES